MTWTPTPAARTLTQLQTDVGNYIYAPVDTSLADVITVALNDGIRELNSRTRWPWLLVVESISLVADTADYELTTAPAKSIRHLHLLGASSKEKDQLLWMDPQTFVREFPDRSTSGTPTHYTTFNLRADGKISLSSPPASAFISQFPEMKVRLFRRLLYYSAAGDTLTSLGSGNPEAENFITWRAKAHMAANKFPEMATRADRLARDIWAQLIRDCHDVTDFD